MSGQSAASTASLGLREAPAAAPAGPEPVLALFLCLFSVQAGVVTLSPILAEVAADFDVSTATAGQLRSASGLVAGLTALGMGRIAARFGLREILLAGLATLAGASLGSAAAPSFGFLAAAQVALGLGLALVLSGGLAAAAEWSAPARQSKVLSWALIGQPSAWIVGLPIIGLLGQVSWRWCWVAVPFLASAAALALIARRPSDPRRESHAGAWRLLTGDRLVAAWAAGELLAWSAWAGTLVYAGALLVESYGVSTATAGVVLGAAAVAYLPGNMLARRHVEGSARQLAAATPLVGAVLVVLFGAVRPATAVSGALLAAAAFCIGGRTLAGSALGLQVCAQRRIFAMRIRAAATQFGYLFGSALGGLALAAGGYPALGAALGGLFVLGALPHIVTLAAARGSR